MAAGPEDLYEILGVAGDASREEIVRAYRRQAQATHPDMRPGDPGAPARFGALTHAYRVLSDPRRRAAHDRDVASRRQPQPQPQPWIWPSPPQSPASPRRPGAPWPVGTPLWAGPVHIEPPAPPGGPGAPAGPAAPPVPPGGPAHPAHAGWLAGMLDFLFSHQDWDLYR